MDSNNYHSPGDEDFGGHYIYKGGGQPPRPDIFGQRFGPTLASSDDSLHKRGGANGRGPSMKSNYPNGDAVHPARQLSSMYDHYYATPDGGLRPSPQKAAPSTDSTRTGPGSKDGRPEGVWRVLAKYAEKCSMQGVPYIHSTKSFKVKVAWWIILVLAVGAMTYHLYRLFDTFLEFNKNTQVQLSFSSLPFPAVTVCGVNPIRASRRHLASQELNDYMNSMDPLVLAGYVEQWDPTYEDVDDYYEDTSSTGTTLVRKKRQTDSSSDSSSSSVSTSNFFDDGDFTNTSTELQQAVDDFYDTYVEDSWENEADVSEYYEMMEYFRQLYVTENATKRAEMGHQISDMLLQCSFGGRTCYARNFTRVQSSVYGNCYTLQYSKFISKKSGPVNGLDLKIFLESDEYIPGVTNSKGVQVVVHPQDTVPFPDEEGQAVKAGTETFIGLRRVQIERLGRPYGDCTPSSEFLHKYGIKYTRTACQKICQQIQTREQCGCYDSLEEEVNRLISRTGGDSSLGPCTTVDQTICALTVETEYETNSSCNCYSPCSETYFEKTVSSRTWPSNDFATLLKATVCKQNTSICQGLESKDTLELRDEFIKLNIYYEDLNYEELSEAEDYATDQFASDVGGTLGLWIGLSILSIFEIFHLLYELCRYLCCQRQTPSSRQERYKPAN